MQDKGSPKPSLSKLMDFLSGIPDTAKSSFIAISGGINQLVSFKTLVIIAGVVFILHLFDVITLPFWPFTTQGRIYVDSPEVYTRERLVNDRYDQDYWLRKQLEKLDKLDLQLVTATEKTELDAQSSESTGDSSNSEGGAGQSQLTFEQEFRVVAGVRDKIRQQILENMLDDRHDLSGNSVYGLKFDTTVIPGSNTHERAFVHVQLQVDDLFSSEGVDEQGGISNELPDYVRGYANANVQQPDDKLRDIVDAYDDQFGYYKTWLNDIAERLNRMEDSVYATIYEACKEASGSDFFDQLTSSTLEIVLGIPEERFIELNPSRGDDLEGAIGLPEPWVNFFQIYRRAIPDKDGGKVEERCDFRVWFEVTELNEPFMAVQRGDEKGSIFECRKLEKPSDTEKSSAENAEDKRAGCNEKEERIDLIQVGETDDATWAFYFCEEDLVWRELWFGAGNLELKYHLSSKMVEALLNHAETSTCDDVHIGTQPPPAPNCYSLTIPSGFFNFVEGMSELDAYSYAIFPKNDVIGILAETSAQLKGEVPGSGFLGIGKQLSESRTASVLVGYGDARGGDPAGDGVELKDGNSIAFGWVISALGDMEPTQKNQLALVSVPAWTDKMSLTVYVGWLDREGNPDWEEEPISIEIAVPPDFEAFDSIFRQDAWVMREPRIQDEAMDPKIYVKADEKAKILIPGSRLWRSTSVTLGAQLATRIRVLPNMEGIIAEFDKIDLPYAAYCEETDKGDTNEQHNCEKKVCPEKMGNLHSRPVTLRVWTSEGVDKAPHPVCVFYDQAKITAGEYSTPYREKPSVR